MALPISFNLNTSGWFLAADVIRNELLCVHSAVPFSLSHCLPVTKRSWLIPCGDMAPSQGVCSSLLARRTTAARVPLPRDCSGHTQLGVVQLTWNDPGPRKNSLWFNSHSSQGTSLKRSLSWEIHHRKVSWKHGIEFTVFVETWPCRWSTFTIEHGSNNCMLHQMDCS